MNHDSENQSYEFVLNLIDLWKQVSKDKVKMVDFERYGTMMKTEAELKSLLVMPGELSETEVDLSDLFDAGSIEIKMDEFSIINTRQFADVIVKADSFSIYPRTDGKLQLSMTFGSVLKTIGSRK